MLLGDLVLNDVRARTAATRVWAIRERTEHEAATLFTRLGADLRESGAPRRLADLALGAAADERVHATRCRALIDALVPGVAPLAPDADVHLGPRHAPAARRALHASVALGCVTESLSTALLIQMRSGAIDPLVKETLDAILEDEVRHARLGWAHLSLAAESGDVSWLAASVPAMIEGAVATEPAAEVLGDPDERRFLREHGILAPEEVTRIVTVTVQDTIAPGLRAHGLWLEAPASGSPTPGTR